MRDPVSKGTVLIHQHSTPQEQVTARVLSLKLHCRYAHSRPDLIGNSFLDLPRFITDTRTFTF